MPDSRETETQQARELHLLRDERDREVDAQGAGKAGRAVLWAAQLLAVLCIWQGDPAWAALLALTFVFAAAQLFHRFAADREGPPLLLGLAAAAAAVGLAVWFFLHSRPAWLTVGRLVELAVLYNALCAAAAAAFLGLTLGAFWLKYKLGRMDGDKWEAYFSQMSTAGLLGRLGALLALGLAAAAALGYFVFRWRGFACPGQLTAAFLLLGLLRLPKKLADRRDELVSKLLRFKSASFAPEPGEQ